MNACETNPTNYPAFYAARALRLTYCVKRISMGCFLHMRKTQPVRKFSILRFVQTCANCMRLCSKIDNFFTGCVFCMRKKQPRLKHFMQYVWTSLYCVNACDELYMLFFDHSKPPHSFLDSTISPPHRCLEFGITFFAKWRSDPILHW